MSMFRDILLIVILMAGFTPYGMADEKNNTLLASSHQSGISQQKAVTIAQQHIKGRVLAANRIDNMYRIKILSHQGSVHILMIHAINGSIISSH